MERKIVGYVRVSTAEEAESAQALKEQVKRLEEQESLQIFADVASGTEKDRSEFGSISSSTDSLSLEA